KSHVGDVLCAHHRMHGYALERDLLLLLEADALRLGLRLDHAIHAAAFDHARLDGVDADSIASQLHGQALGETHHTPLRSGIGCAQRKAEPPCSGGEIDDAAAAGRLEHRYAEARAIEHAVQVDVDAAAPVLDTDLLHFAGGTRDACVVHQHVESAEIV